MKKSKRCTNPDIMDKDCTMVIGCEDCKYLSKRICSVNDGSIDFCPIDGSDCDKENCKLYVKP